jgi:diphthine synthase
MKKGSLTFIGLGLFDERDISLKGLDVIKESDKVFVEFYTGKLVGSNIKKIEKTIGKKITVLHRQEIEKGKIVIDTALDKNVVFLTEGDSMTATTHIDLRIRANNKGIKTRVIHGSSIITAVPGLLGLQNYKFGRTTTLAYPEKNYFPTSPYDVIKENKKMGLHTMVLLDIQADKDVYMTANQALDFLLEMENIKNEKLLNKNSVIAVVARAGSKEPVVRAGMLKDLKKIDFGPPLHTIVIPGKLHFMEIEALMILAQLPAYLGEKLQKI